MGDEFPRSPDPEKGAPVFVSAVRFFSEDTGEELGFFPGDVGIPVPDVGDEVRLELGTLRDDGNEAENELGDFIIQEKKYSYYLFTYPTDGDDRSDIVTVTADCTVQKIS